jgi:hypothetical protein
MKPLRQPENRPGQDPQIFCSRANPDFSNACDHLGKIQVRSAGAENLTGSNRRTVFSKARVTGTNYLLPHNKTDNNKKPLIESPFFQSKPSFEG